MRPKNYLLFRLQILDIPGNLPSLFVGKHTIVRSKISKLTPKMWYLYILDCDNKCFYVGVTTDLNNRLQQHQNGQSRFTKRFKEITLVYTEGFEKKEDAVAREKEIKGWSRKKKLKLIRG